MLAHRALRSDLAFLPREPYNCLLAATDTSLHLLQSNEDATALVGACDVVVSALSVVLHVAQSESAVWRDAHDKCAITSVACDEHSDSVATSGEDNCIRVRSVDVRSTVFFREKSPIFFLFFDLQSELDCVVLGADCDVVHDVCFVSRDVLASCNAAGHLSLWDARGGADPVRVLHEGDEAAELWCLERHPDQPHTIVTGYVAAHSEPRVVVLSACVFSATTGRRPAAWRCGTRAWKGGHCRATVRTLETCGSWRFVRIRRLWLRAPTVRLPRLVRCNSVARRHLFVVAF